MESVTAVVTCMTDAERPFLPEALRSVLTQTAPCQVRLYVEEGNSWVEPLLAAMPPVCLRRVPLAPAAFIRNLGVREARADWVAFLDGDDIWEPDKIARQLDFARKVGADFVGADHSIVDEHGRFVAYGLARYIPMTSSWLVRRKVMLAHPFPAVPRHEDGAWWIETLDRVARRRLPEFLLRYRVRPNSQSSDKRQRKARLVELSRQPAFTPLLRIGSGLLHRLHRDTFYVRHPAWHEGH